MVTPDGQSGDKTDKIMLLAMWANTLQKENPSKSIIFAGMGKPTYSIHVQTIQTFLNYWEKINVLRSKALSDPSNKKIAEAAIGYGDPQGDSRPREIMAKAMTKWYETDIYSQNILFTVGGAGALRIIFETFNTLYFDTPKYRVIAPFPHYTLYADNHHQLHPVDVMKEPGYQLTAKALEASIKSANLLAQKDNNFPRVVLLSNPSNPLGTVISESELIKIAQVLRCYPDLYIVFDEAYAEMTWYQEKIPSLIKIAPDLKDRTIILRSATKAFSAAGERMAMLMAFNPTLMNKLCDKSISTIGHPARSAQIAYAETMASFNDTDKNQLKLFYQPKLNYVIQRLQEIGASMPDPLYKVDSTFYTMADFTDLLGIRLPEDARRALNKTGNVQTSEELSYYLLFKEAIMIAPGSYFGLPKNNGFMRITCSGSYEELKDLMDRLEKCLLQARKNKTERLINDITSQMNHLKLQGPEKHEQFSKKIISILDNNQSCLALQQQNKKLEEILSAIRVSIKQLSREGQISAARTIQSFYTQMKKDKKSAEQAQVLANEWHNFVNAIVLQEGAVKNYFLNFNENEKLNFKPWLEHLEKIKGVEINLLLNTIYAII